MKKVLAYILLFISFPVFGQLIEPDIYIINGDTARLIETKQGFLYPKPTDLSSETGLVAAYNMINQSGTLTDVSGNGNDGIIVGATQRLSGLDFDGVNDEVKFLNIGLGTSHTVLTRIILSDASTNSVVVGGSPSYIIYIGGGSNRLYYRGDGTNYVQFNDINFINNEPTNVAIVRDGLTVKLYINGVQKGNTQTLLANNAASFSKLGKFGSVYMHGTIERVDAYNYAFTESEVESWHNSYATQVNYRNTFEFEGVGNKPFGWTEGTGTYEIGEDSDGKYVECMSSGTAYFQSKQAYGTWEFEMYKGDDGNTSVYQFISLTSEYTESDNYWIRIANDESIDLIRGSSVILSTAASYIDVDVMYGLKVIRELGGEITLYIKGGDFGDSYTLVDVTGGAGTNPVTDNTYTVSNYTVINNDSDDRIGPIVYTKGVVK